MSVRTIALVFRQSEATLGARLVLLTLADAGHDDGVTWISQEKLAEKTKLGVTSVKRVISELEELGEIEVRKAQRGRRRINVYRVSLHGVEEPRYDDYPFTLSAPFTTAQNGPSSKADDSPSSSLTTAHPETSSPPVLSLALPVSVNRKETAPTSSARELVGFYVDETSRLGGVAPARVKGHLAKLVGELLAEGIPVEKVQAGITLLVERRMHPSALPSAVNEASLPPAGPRRAAGTITAQDLYDSAVRHAQEGR